MGRSFAEVLDHARVMEKMHHEVLGCNDKRPRYQGSFIGSRSSF